MISFGLAALCPMLVWIDVRSGETQFAVGNDFWLLGPLFLCSLATGVACLTIWLVRTASQSLRQTLVLFGLASACLLPMLVAAYYAELRSALRIPILCALPLLVSFVLGATTCLGIWTVGAMRRVWSRRAH